MYLGEVSTKQLISVALMILFALSTMFFIGYKYAYDKAVRYANDQIEEKVNELENRYNLRTNPDFILGNIPPLEIRGQNE